MYPNLNDQYQFWLNKINGVKDYFITEIREIELMSERICKCIAPFGYPDRSLIVLPVTNGEISIASFANAISAPVEIGRASFSFAFSITTEIVKKYLKKQNKNKTHNKIVILTRNKLDTLESKRSEDLMNNEIFHEDFTTIMNEEKNYRELKERIKMMKIKK